MSSPASHRLDVVITIPVFNDCVLIVNFFQTYCHRVSLITRVLALDILFTSAIVKTILAGVVFTSDVKTLCIDLDPTSQPWTLQTTQSQCSTCWSRPHLGNSLPHLRLRQLCRLIPRHLENLLVHVLLQLLQCRASLGTTTVDFTLFTRSFTYCVCVTVIDIMSSAFVSLWVYSFLGVLQALLMIDLSSIIVFLLRFTRSWCFLLRPATSRVLRT